MAGNYLAELDALQRWIWQTAGLKSVRLNTAQPKEARPIVLWEAPTRRRQSNIGRYKYVNGISQYGKLYVTSLEQLFEIQEKLLGDLEDRTGLLPIFQAGTQTQIGWLKNVTIEFSNSETLDVPLTVKYEATYGRVRPVAPPAATRVVNKLEKPAEGGSV